MEIYLIYAIYPSTTPRMVGNHLQDGQSPTIQNVVTHLPEVSPLPSRGWSPSLLRMVNQYPNYGHIPSPVDRSGQHWPKDGLPLSQGMSHQTSILTLAQLSLFISFSNLTSFIFTQERVYLHS